MRRKRWFVALVLPVVACAGVALWAACADRRHGPFWDRYQWVQLGMTEEEVVEILGPPHGFVYPGGSLGPRSCWWDEGQQAIGVDFDAVSADGPLRATRKHFSPETVWERLERMRRRNGYDLRRWVADWP